MFHVSFVASVVSDLFDISNHFFPFLIISLITLLFLLPDTFNFHDVVDKYPAYSWWGPWHSGRERASHRFRRCSRWSYIAKQCTVVGWLRRVHLPHRERSRHALHHPGRIDSRRKKSRKGQAVSVFHSREPDVRQSRSGRSSIRSGQNPELLCTRIFGEFTKIELSWCNLKLPQTKGLRFYQTRSHAIALFNTLLAICIEKVVYMKTGEDLYCKVHQSPRLPRVVLTPNLRCGRQDLSNPEARTSSDHKSERSGKYEKTRRSRYEEARRGNVDYRIPGILHSTVQKEDSKRKETVKILIQQFENHLNRDSLIQDLNNTEEFNPFSEKSKELITSMGNTECTSSLCETSSKIQCPHCALFWEVGIFYCTRGECMQPTERNRQLNKARYDVLSIPGYVIKQNPTHGARHGPSVRQCMCCKAHDMLRKASKQNHSGKMERWWQIPQVFVRYWVDWGTDHSIWCNRMGRPLLRGYMARKKSERKILDNFSECRRYSRAIESA